MTTDCHYFHLIGKSGKEEKNTFETDSRWSFASFNRILIISKVVDILQNKPHSFRIN